MLANSFGATSDEDIFVAFIQAYFDESGKFKDHRVVSLCGFTGEIRTIQTFDAGWKPLLRAKGMRALHMKKAARFTQPLGQKDRALGLENRKTALLSFAECARDNMEAAVQVAVDVHAFNSLSRDEQKTLGGDPYYLAFQHVLAALLDHYGNSGEQPKISLIFDEEQHYSIRCYEILARLRGKHSDYQRALVSISFADDEFFTVLQAADMLAYLVREEAQTRFCHGPAAQFSGLYAHITDANVTGNLAVLGGFYGLEQLRTLAARSRKRR